MAAFVASACIDPQVSDEVPPRLVHPPEHEVPHVGAADEELAARLRAHQGVDGRPLVADGTTVEVIEPIFGFSGVTEDGNAPYWDLGPAPAFAAPVYFIVEPGSPCPTSATPVEKAAAYRLADHVATAGNAKTGPRPHPPIIDVVPGDPGYSPFWAIYCAEATPRYADQVFASLDGLRDAQRAGLIREPKQFKIALDACPKGGCGFFVNCPVVSPNMRLSVPGSEEEYEETEYADALHAPEQVFYYREVAVHAFNLAAWSGVTPLGDADNAVEVPRSYLVHLRRPGAPPLSEVARQANMNPPGDPTDRGLRDTNDLLASGSPARRVVEAAVSGPARGHDDRYRSFDGDDTPQYDAIEQVFERTEEGELRPREGRVVSWRETGRVVNAPIIRGGG